jgi:hypothetical protein
MSTLRAVKKSFSAMNAAAWISSTGRDASVAPSSDLFQHLRRHAVDVGAREARCDQPARMP